MTPSSTSNLPPPYSEAPSNYSRCQSSLLGNSIPKNIDRPSQEDTNAHIAALDKQEGTAPNTDSENSGTDSSRGQSESRRPHSAPNANQSSRNPMIDPVLAFWIRGYSNFRVELHLHTLSIPSVKDGPSP